jgi:hypothetical protein
MELPGARPKRATSTRRLGGSVVALNDLSKSDPSYDRAGGELDHGGVVTTGR